MSHEIFTLSQLLVPTPCLGAAVATTVNGVHRGCCPCLVGILSWSTKCQIKEFAIVQQLGHEVSRFKEVVLVHLEIH